MKILILERSEALCKELIAALGRCVAGAEARFEYHHPQEVFSILLPADADLAFITVSSMADVEATRQFHRLYGDIPFVVVSDSEEYAVESFRFPAKGYMTRPVSPGAVYSALCAV